MLKGWDAIGARMKTREKEAVSPLAIELQAVKLNLERQGKDLNDFKVEVARTYVTGESSPGSSGGSTTW